MRLIYPTAGTARILDRDIGDVAMHARIGYLPGILLLRLLTAREFLNYCGELFGLDRDTRERRTKELLTLVNLESKGWDRQLRKFRRAAATLGLAQALVNDPEIVFLDEPMSGLDPVGRREVRESDRFFAHPGKTVFMCSHILQTLRCCATAWPSSSTAGCPTGLAAELRAGEANAVEVIATGPDAEF